ncbi:MAG: M48 family metallopeptidase [Clostridia bacterium]|nr:M48 family metallopeptidase [Clostridia bacterium]
MKLNVLGYEVEVTARRQNKHLRMRVVPPNGDIKVSCPPGTPVKRVEQFVRDNLIWVQKSQAKVESSSQTLSYINGGEYLVLFGTKYKIVEREENRFSIVLDNETAFLSSPKSTERKEKVEFIKRYLKKVATDVFPPLVAKYEAVIGVKSSGLSYRFMTSRWGSCNTKTKRISFSVYAVEKPMAYVEYLVCHELLHIIYPNHGKEFKNALRKIIPNADKIAKLK